MPSPWFAFYPERDARTKGSVPEPTRRKSGGAGKGREGTYPHAMPGPSRKIHQVMGRRVKRSMRENF